MDNFEELILTILASSGGATLIVLGLARYLGKIWAERLMASERLEHSKALETLRNELRKDHDTMMVSISHELEILKDTHLREHNDKLIIYRKTIETVAQLLAKLEMVVLRKSGPLSHPELEAFERDRLSIYGHLGMLAPQEVMDANDRLTDLLLGVIYEDQEVTWKTIRSHALDLLNEMRKDVGLDKSEIQYNGLR